MGQGKKGLIITIIILVVTLLVVGGFVVWQNASKQPVVETSETDTNTNTEDTPAVSNTDSETPTEDTPVETIDPATLSSIDIEPLGIAVFYKKGVPGFEFAVKRASDKTQYVEFSSPDLVGTKCTDDTGLFASIIKNPSNNATITKTVTIDSDTYGLTLAGENCTKDVALLKEYQDAFTYGLSQTKKL